MRIHKNLFGMAHERTIVSQDHVFQDMMKPGVHVLHGTSGSGKSTLAGRMLTHASKIGKTFVAVVNRTDIEVRRTRPYAPYHRPVTETGAVILKNFLKQNNLSLPLNEKRSAILPLDNTGENESEKTALLSISHVLNNPEFRSPDIVVLDETTLPDLEYFLSFNRTAFDPLHGTVSLVLTCQWIDERTITRIEEKLLGFRPNTFHLRTQSEDPAPEKAVNHQDRQDRDTGTTFFATLPNGSIIDPTTVTGVHPVILNSIPGSNQRYEPPIADINPTSHPNRHPNAVRIERRHGDDLFFQPDDGTSVEELITDLGRRIERK